MVYFLIVLGLMASLFFGLACMSMHIHSKWHHQHGSTLPIRRWLVNEPTGTRYTMPHLIYQVWLNFVGAAVGWIAIIVLYQDLAAQPAGRMVNALNWPHWGLGLVGVVGIVGWLPMTLSGLVNSLTALAKAISDWLASKLAK
jgi:hypothetical protein